jgi:hypothetical protein
MTWQPDYVTVDDYDDWSRREGLDDPAVDEPVIADKISAASRTVDAACGRQFGLADAPVLRRYTPVWRPDRCRWMADIDDLMLPDDLVVTCDAGTVDLFELEPVNALADGKPYTRIVIDPDAAALPVGNRHELRATVRWGWLAYPAGVPAATLLQTSRLLFRRDSPAGVAGSPAAGGSELRLLARVDADVAVLLKGLPRTPVPR